MDNYPLRLFWNPFEPDSDPLPMTRMLPFHEAGTSSFPGHTFAITDEFDASIVYQHFVIGDYQDNIQVYDPYLIENNPQQTKLQLQEQLNDME